MLSYISPQDLDILMKRAGSYALVDIRDKGVYNSTHIPGASSLPRQRIEYEMFLIAPFRGVEVVLCDDDGDRATMAAATLERMGYSNVRVLEGGINRWTSLDYPTEWGTNVASKDFGEKVEVEHNVPEIDSVMLQSKIEDAERLVILDTRTPEEYQKFCIPGGRNVPNGELVLRITDVLNPLDKDTTVIINCAGRTRSIIGTRSLQRMGFNNVYGLKNGTAGWTLAGLELEVGANRFYSDDVSPEGLAIAENYANKIADEDGVEYLNVKELNEIMERRTRETVYLVDVRTREEYEKGHIPGFRWVPGGQAVQCSDDVAAVRNGVIVFACNGMARAALVASWYRQMGFPHVYALNGGTTAWVRDGLPLEVGSGQERPFGFMEAKKLVISIAARDIEIGQFGAIIFVDTSDVFAAGHLTGSHWLPRGDLEFRITNLMPNLDQPILCTCTDGTSSLLAGATLLELGYRNVSVLENGVSGWISEGLTIEKGLTNVMTPPNDTVVMGPHRSYADTIHYLRWETELGKKYET